MKPFLKFFQVKLEVGEEVLVLDVSDQDKWQVCINEIFPENVKLCKISDHNVVIIRSCGSIT
jgi:hypothetical protein